MKDLGTLFYFFGIEFSYSHRGYLLSQLTFIANVLASLLFCTRETNSPLELNVK